MGKIIQAGRIVLIGATFCWGLLGLGSPASAQCAAGNPLMLCPLATCLTLQADVTLQCKTPPPTSCSGIVGCSLLRAMKSRWLACGAARSRINAVCFGGGDLGHQTALSQVWTNVATCDARMALPRPTGCTDPCASPLDAELGLPPAAEGSPKAYEAPPAQHVKLAQREILRWFRWP